MFLVYPHRLARVFHVYPLLLGHSFCALTCCRGCSFVSSLFAQYPHRLARVFLVYPLSPFYVHTCWPQWSFYWFYWCPYRLVMVFILYQHRLARVVIVCPYRLVMASNVYPHRLTRMAMVFDLRLARVFHVYPHWLARVFLVYPHVAYCVSTQTSQSSQYLHRMVSIFLV